MLGEVEEGRSLQWEGHGLRVAGNVGCTCRPPSSRQPPTSQTGLLAPTRPGPDCGGGRSPRSRSPGLVGAGTLWRWGGRVQLWGAGCWRQQEPPPSWLNNHSAKYANGIITVICFADISV